MRTIAQEQARYRWLTTREAGERIGGVTPEHVLRLIRAGEIEARDVSLPSAKRADYRIDPESVAQFCARRKVVPEAVSAESAA